MTAHDDTREPSAHPQYLTFLVAGEEHAVGILRVREILQYAGVTRVPRTPEWIRGVINLRGSVVPVVDLAVKLGLPPSEDRRSTCVVITEVHIEGEPIVMGLLTDAVRQVIELPAQDVQPAPAFGTRVRVDFLLGMGRVGERLVLLLDVDRLLSADEIVSAASAAEALAPTPDALAQAS
ncbi:MAG TPA: chemotaxis protein CheW [Vicinamibacteria bacterium]|nr:chemotaxis protein CheW [Vicinamibacteria bacterium]